VDSSALTSVSMFDAMSTTWAYGIPWTGTDTADSAKLSFHQVLEMATINGARALGLEDVTGSLTPGKRADIILVRADDINMVPVGNVETALVHSATVANVDTVIAGGRVLKRAGIVVNIDEEAIKEDVKRSLYDLRKKAGGRWAPGATDARRF
jgi:cytosine/adenosine deaminase-related metal-dependent hydrolase